MEKLADVKALVALVLAALLVALDKIGVDAFLCLAVGAQFLGKPVAEARALVGR